jgi:exportin-7
MEEIEALVIGILRDLRGLCSSLVSKSAYESFFNWLHPAFLSSLLKAAYIFSDRADIYNPLLKFLQELVSNRQERLMFDSMKASAYLLFRETATVLYLFHIKTIPHIANTVSESDEMLFYKSKLKPIITCFHILQTCLAGEISSSQRSSRYERLCFQEIT